MRGPYHECSHSDYHFGSEHSWYGPRIHSVAESAYINIAKRQDGTTNHILRTNLSRASAGTNGSTFSGKYSLCRVDPIDQIPTTIVSGIFPFAIKAETVSAMFHDVLFQVILASKIICPSCI